MNKALQYKKVKRCFYGKLSGKSWSKKMLDSYLQINLPYGTYTTAEQSLILERLKEDYIINTFGPAGQNKTVCDFFMCFFNSNTTTPLKTRANTKTGAILRWNYGGGNVYEQNDLPGQINNGLISVTSEDGFLNFQTFSLYNNFFIKIFPFGSIQNISILYLHVNEFEQDIENLNILPLQRLYLHVNKFSGNISNWTLPDTMTHFYIYSNYRLTGICPSLKKNIIFYFLYNNVFTDIDIENSEFNISLSDINLNFNLIGTIKLNNLISKLKDFYFENIPSTNLIISMIGSQMGSMTNTTDATAIINYFTAAGKTCSILYNP